MLKLPGIFSYIHFESKSHHFRVGYFSNVWFCLHVLLYMNDKNTADVKRLENKQQ